MIGARALHLVNGRLVLAIENMRLAADGTPLTRGLIQIQSEGAEVYYRGIKIRPATSFPDDLAQQAAFTRN